MASLYRLPCFLPLSSHNLILNHHYHHHYQEQEFKVAWKIHEDPSPRHFRICACSISRPRSARKVKSNVELCNDLREFASAVGLPEGHVPSLKELADHGRTDLANIVRRRGYKLIRDLLSNSTKEDADGSNLEKSLAEGQDAIIDAEDISTGQDEKVKDVSEDSPLSTEVPIMRDHYGSTYINPECSSGDHSCMSVESYVNLSLRKKDLYDAKWQDEEVKSMVQHISLSTSSNSLEQQDEEVKLMVEDNSLSTEFSTADDNMNPGLSSNNYGGITIETLANTSLEEEAICNSKTQDEKVNNVEEGTSFSTGVSNVVYDANNMNTTQDLNFGDHGSISMDSAANSLLNEKVAKFIQDGDLDAIEDYGILIENGTEESKGFGENFEDTVGRSNTALKMTGALSTSTQALSLATVNNPIRNDHLSDEGLADSGLDEDLAVETSKRENQVEINHLKFMLHQKELELFRLQEQIEKEKLALSILQTKAETEISRVQKLISEKDAELLATEEGLSGLVEVKIEYCGEGEIVEVAGSFNGWHHRVKMDPQPSSSISEPIGSRKFRLWSTMLWLYPGVYEIKFIVDGRWRVDPQRESVTRAGISNNLLRVDK